MSGSIDGLLAQQAWNSEKVWGLDGAGFGDSEAAGLEDLFVLEDGNPGSTVHSIKAIVAGGNPALRNDRFAAAATARPRELAATSVEYVEYLSKYVLKPSEYHRLFNVMGSGDVQVSSYGKQLIDKAYRYSKNVMYNAAVQVLANADSTTYLSIPAGDGSSTAEALASAAHTTQVSGTTWDNLGAIALTQDNFATNYDAMTLEVDPWGAYNKPIATTLFGQSPSKLHSIISSEFGSSALQKTKGYGMNAVVLPGMGDMWGLSTGPQVGGLTIGFEHEIGRPHVGNVIYNEADEVYEIPYGCSFAILCGTYSGLYFSTP